MPVTVSAGGVLPPLHEQINELQRKIQLLDGDQKAFYESSQWTIKKNKESITRLRQENKKLHKRLAQVLAGDEKVIQEAFQNRESDKAAVGHKSGQAAIQIVDQKVCEKIKRLNALKHQSALRKQRLEELQLIYSQRQLECQSLPSPDNDSSQEAQSEGGGSEDESLQTLRILENRLEKALLKSQEAEYIMNVYQKLKDHMQEESLTFQNQLDLLEVEILRQRHELKELQQINNDANLSRDVARAELQHHEEIMYRERRERDEILHEFKRQVEERQIQAERADRRALRMIIQPEEVSEEALFGNVGIQDEEKAIKSFQEAFQRIKDATAVTDIQDVVDRFVAQGETRKHLDELKTMNEKTLVRLREDKEHLEAEYQELKYSGEAKLSSGQKMLEQLEMHLKTEERRRDRLKEESDRAIRILAAAKAGVQHLAGKVQHIRLPKKEFRKPLAPVTSDEYVLDLLATTEERLQLLLDDLEEEDLPEVVKQMEEEEFHATIEGKLPSYNVRVKIPVQAAQPIYPEEDSGDDDADIVTRATLKRQSQQIIDSKTKRRSRPKKKKGKN
ncbi:LOW QUALITY PROTEIN: coiled-coil domain-containing protein 151 [Rhinatrema bivittatum]|uniref:LOW QUALITY PROTEIN: coiled-coil domain-containing protein 151 n=1 Tax=Rhinatrema bivittatum TaxID=194408 RepID=UPI00112C9304|nr:LOW QUALITY PROTEIN: coiled-coil domain-containing protein 151 [Rhinatrema bivittatum]